MVLDGLVLLIAYLVCLGLNVLWMLPHSEVNIFFIVLVVRPGKESRKLFSNANDNADGVGLKRDACRNCVRSDIGVSCLMRPLLQWIFCVCCWCS